MKSPKHGAWDGTGLRGLGENPDMYFIHSYYVAPTNPKECLAQTVYGETTFCSVVKKDNITGCQFHPERSSELGLKLLRNFTLDAE